MEAQQLHPTTNNSWKPEQIHNANDTSGFCQINGVISGIFYTENILMCIYTGLFVICPYFGWNIPDFIPFYTENPVCIINALLLMVLYNGHDRYYSITKRTLLLSEHTFLQCIDFLTKCSLIIVSILQLINVELFVAICFYGYLLTFVRASYLSIKIDKAHPLAKRVQKTWLPNNIRHNVVMLLWVLLYYLVLQPTMLYGILASILSIPIDFESPQVIHMLYITRQAFMIVFDAYWIHRVLKKVVVKKNRSFHAAKEKELFDEVEDYYAKENSN